MSGFSHRIDYKPIEMILVSPSHLINNRNRLVPPVGAGLIHARFVAPKTKAGQRITDHRLQTPQVFCLCTDFNSICGLSVLRPEEALVSLDEAGTQAQTNHQSSRRISQA